MNTTGTDPLGEAMLSVCGETMDAMVSILESLGDVRANTRPPVAGANSPYAIVFHCVGVIEYWAGSVIAGLRIPRDRDAEFTATGSVAVLVDRMTAVRGRLPGWVDIAVGEGLRDRAATGSTRAEAATASPEWVLMHIQRELAQHLGQLELTRDVLNQAEA
ncbi:DinB family protein [Williamsia sp.]|uniref:DinB family protein n=1 Tax=Williamsia sp. TaxID=1872085 RepID=UPI002F944C0E